MTLYPYKFYFPITKSNGLIKKESCISLKEPGIAITKNNIEQFTEQLMKTNCLSIEMYLKTKKTQQIGPARIFSFSKDRMRRNFTIGQQNNDLIFRLRTTGNNLNGTAPEIKIPEVFADTTNKLILITYDGRFTKCFVNKKLILSTDKIHGSFDNWNKNYALVLGNEATRNRPWLGSIYYIRVYNKVINPLNHNQTNSIPLIDFNFKNECNNYIVNNSKKLSQIKLLIPKTFVPRVNHFDLFPFRYWPFKALSLATFFTILFNVFLFYPIGVGGWVLFKNLTNEGTHPIIWVTFFGLLLSLLIEILQIYIPARDPNIVDVLTNSVGTWLGAYTSKFFFHKTSH